MAQSLLAAGPWLREQGHTADALSAPLARLDARARPVKHVDKVA